MRIWKRLAVASVISAAFAIPAWAGDGDALQSPENQHGNQVERNAVVTPPSDATSTPTWNEQRTYGNSTMALPGSAITSPGTSYESAAEESRATGKVDAGHAAPPQTGADVQPGDMGPSNAKGGSQ